MIIVAYCGLFLVTNASMLQESNRVMSAMTESRARQIEPVTSMR